MRYTLILILFVFFSGGSLSGESLGQHHSTSTATINKNLHNSMSGSIGNFSLSCDACYLSGTELTCNCLKKNKKDYVQSYINLNEKISYKNFNLIFKDGRYVNNCNSCSFSEPSSLACSCNDGYGIYAPVTPLDLNPYIKNEDGKLQWSQ